MWTFAAVGAEVAVQIAVPVLTAVLTAAAARWGSNSGIRAALRGLQAHVNRVEASTIRAHERIDNLHMGK